MHQTNCSGLLAEGSRARRSAMRRSTVRWWAGLLGLGLCLAGCTGNARSAATTSPGPFDPPSRFDFTRAVDLTEDEVWHGTLDGTVFYSVSGGALRATDLLDSGRSWSVDLPGGAADDRQMPPTVVGSMVMVATGHRVEPVGPVQGDREYTINLVGIDTDTHTVAWTQPIPARYDYAYDSYPLTPDREQWFELDPTVRDDGVLVAAHSKYHCHAASLLVDAVTGEVRWQVDMSVVGPTTGRYALAAGEDLSAERGRYTFADLAVFDLHTGQVHEPMDPSLVAGFPYVDPGGDESYAVFSIASDSSSGYLRFSSADGATQPFVPAAGDVRYGNHSCTTEPGQAVIVCGGRDQSVYGVDRTSGEVLWELTASVEQIALYHGYVYTGGRVYALDTGEVINRDTGPGSLWVPGPDPGGPLSIAPILVNEYGAVGTGPDGYVWVPASG